MMYIRKYFSFVDIDVHSTNNHNNTINSNNNIYMVVPYTKGSGESFKNICGKVGSRSI